jgi:hypothetical protein
MTANIITLWYLAGLYLMSLGFLLLTDDGDIFIGFLWIIDLGVALIFFIFILHFGHFLHQKISLNMTNKNLVFFIFFLFFMLSFFYFMANPFTSNNYELRKTWFLLINWYDFYSFYNSFTTTDLNLIRELYFYHNSFEFFLINFVVFYGIFGAINLTFLIKKVFSFMNFAQIKNFKLLLENNSTLFIRNQNFLKQQSASTGTRVWSKKKNFSL